MYFVINLITLCVVWVLLSGQFDLFHLSLGAISCFLVALMSTDLVYTDRQKGMMTRVGEAGRFISYTGWLLYQIVLANFHVLQLPSLLSDWKTSLILTSSPLKPA